VEAHYRRDEKEGARATVKAQPLILLLRLARSMFSVLSKRR